MPDLIRTRRFATDSRDCLEEFKTQAYLLDVIEKFTMYSKDLWFKFVLGGQGILVYRKGKSAGANHWLA